MVTGAEEEAVEAAEEAVEAELLLPEAEAVGAEDFRVQARRAVEGYPPAERLHKVREALNAAERRRDRVEVEPRHNRQGEPVRPIKLSVSSPGVQIRRNANRRLVPDRRTGKILPGTTGMGTMGMDMSTQLGLRP